MTEPHWARTTERGRYYVDPSTGDLLPSVTNIIGTCVAKPRLLPWAARITAEWALAHLDEIREHVGPDRAALIAAMAGEHAAVTDHAADLGTRVHVSAEADVLGAPIPDDPEVAPYLRQFRKWCASWGVDYGRDVDAAEFTVLNRTVGYAGTGDLLVRLPTGVRRRRQRWLVDYKSSATRPASSVFPEYELQLVGLRNGEIVLLRDGSEHRLPRIDRVAILNLRRNSHALIPMPADTVAFAAFSSLVTPARWLHDAPTTYPVLKPPPAGAPTPRKAA